MGIATLGGIKISRDQPKISVRIVNNTENLDDCELRIKRVGQPIEFVAYTPSRVLTDYVEFTFDELLFSEKEGKYQARFMANGEVATTIYLFLENATKIIATQG